MRTKSPEQVLRLDGKNVFLEVMAGSLAIDQVNINFVQYNGQAKKGSREVANIGIFIEPIKAGVLAKDIMSGKIRKLGEKATDAAAAGGYKYPKEVYCSMGGTPANRANRPDGHALSRQFKLTPGNTKPWVLSAETGPGQENETGLIVPSYKNPEKIVRVGVTDDELKLFAEALTLVEMVWASEKFGGIVSGRISENVSSQYKKMADEAKKNNPTDTTAAATAGEDGAA